MTTLKLVCANYCAHVCMKEHECLIWKFCRVISQEKKKVRINLQSNIMKVNVKVVEFNNLYHCIIKTSPDLLGIYVYRDLVCTWKERA